MHVEIEDSISDLVPDSTQAEHNEIGATSINSGAAETNDTAGLSNLEAAHQVTKRVSEEKGDQAKYDEEEVH